MKQWSHRVVTECALVLFTFFLLIAGQMRHNNIDPAKDTIQESFEYPLSEHLPQIGGGVKVWNNSYNYGLYETSRGIAIDESGNAYVSGWDGDNGFILLKYDQNGNLLWDKFWQNGTLWLGEAFEVDTDEAGNAYFCGGSYNPGTDSWDLDVLKYNPSGTFQWVRTWNGGFQDKGKDISYDGNGHLYVAGYADTSLMEFIPDACLVKYDTSGNLLWGRTWQSENESNGNGVAIDGLGNAYLAGTTSNDETHVDALLVKYDPNGNQIWNRTWITSNFDFGEGVVTDGSNNVYLAGKTNISGPLVYDALLVKYDTNGNQLWNKTWDGGYDEKSFKVAIDGSGNLYLTGEQDRPGAYYLYLAKFDTNGNLLWNLTRGCGYFDRGCAIDVDGSQNVYIAGDTDYASGGDYADMTIVKFSPVPEFSFDAPLEGAIFGADSPSFNTTVVIDPGLVLDESWYNVGSSSINHSFTSNLLTMVDSVDWGAQLNGTMVLTFWANDTNGNLGTTSVLLGKDIESPTITSTGLVDGGIFGATPPELSLVVQEGNLNDTWYSLDDGATNTSCSLVDSLADQWGYQPNGTVTIQFWANDTVGNLGTTSVIVGKDIDSPSILSTGLANGSIFGAAPPAFSLVVEESNFDEALYSLDGGATNTTCGLADSLAGQWGYQPNGTVIVTFYVKDLGTNVNSTTIMLYKDLIPPAIDVNEPLWQDPPVTYTNPPSYSLFIAEGNLDQVWVKVGSDPSNYILTTLSGTIDASAWAKQPDGQVNLTFFASDKAGNWNSKTIFVTKESPGGELAWLIPVLIGGVIGVAILGSIIWYAKKKRNSGGFSSYSKPKKWKKGSTRGII